MRNYLLFLSILLFGLSAHGQSSFDSDVQQSIRRYLFKVELPKASLTGVMLVSEREDCIVGSMVNEFGVSACNFIYNKDNGKLKLIDVVKFLNKWYIKRVLTKDIRIALQILYDIPHNTVKGYLIERNGDTVSLKNLRRNISYEFSLMPECEERDVPDIN